MDERKADRYLFHFSLEKHFDKSKERKEQKAFAGTNWKEARIQAGEPRIALKSEMNVQDTRPRVELIKKKKREKYPPCSRGLLYFQALFSATALYLGRKRIIFGRKGRRYLADRSYGICQIPFLHVFHAWIDKYKREIVFAIIINKIFHFLPA